MIVLMKILQLFLALIRVDKFYLFFDIGGFSLFKFKPRGSDTEYGIGWLPLGGYCKIAGMIDESMDTESLKQEPQPWEFRTKPAWQRLLVMFGGVLFNFIFAIILYIGILAGWGESYIANQGNSIYVNDLAYEMGFRNGDQILKFDDYVPEKFAMLQADLARQTARKATVLRDGDTVDIYLDLVENTLDNINPIFSSTPSKDLNEIMTILGQNILPSGSDTISSVVGILSTGVDVLSRIGLLPTGSSSLSKNIRNTLNLDTFSLHSNVIENLVFDAVSAGERNVNLSPLARYLDGTSIYAGKYISSELYLELMLHLVADEKNLENVSFIAGDLSLDFELSLEWDNPICLVTFFTTPKTFNALDVIENFGFSLTKRFIF